MSRDHVKLDANFSSLGFGVLKFQWKRGKVLVGRVIKLHHLIENKKNQEFW